MHMSDEQRLQTTAKLCHEVLAALPDGQLDLEAAHWVVADTLLLLICKDIKLSSSGLGAADEDDSEAVPNSAAAVATAKSKLLTQVARKAVVESIVPIVIELKRYLERQRSPLLRDIFLFLRELLKDHKQHLQDILSRDRQLASEIEYDLRQLQAQAQQTPRALQPLTPEGNASTPGATPRQASRVVGSKAARTNLSRVPTPDRLKQLSIPKLRADRRASLDGLSSTHPSSSKHTGAPRSHLPPVPKLAPRSENAEPVKQKPADVVMASPFKDAPPPRQWNVSPSPEKAIASSPSLETLAKRQRGMFDDVPC
ncbi:MAG: hypothetical protein SGPRY_012919 [Prymnesium sp.]